MENGYTASKIVPAVAPIVRQLTKIVRAKHWYIPHFGSPIENRFGRFVCSASACLTSDFMSPLLSFSS
jgi:hypothetical protein